MQITVRTFNIHPNVVKPFKVFVFVAIMVTTNVWKKRLNLVKRDTFHSRNEERTTRSLLGNIAVYRAGADRHLFSLST
jgi:hypothetical protein